jgi:hypothetical protein
MKFLSDENFDNTIGFTAMAIISAALVGKFAAFAVGFSAKGCGLGAIVGILVLWVKGLRQWRFPWEMLSVALL